MKLELKQDHPDYVKVHCWLRRKYGKANKCEGDKCNNKSKSFHWALKDGFNYTKDRNAFFNLCASCHKKYDITDFTKLKMSKSKRGEKHPLSKLTKKEVEEIKNRYKFRVLTQKTLAKEYGVCEHTIHYIIKGRTWKN